MQENKSNRRDYLKRYRAENKGRTHRVNITLTSEEYRRFEKQAGNLKVTSFVKMLALSALPEAQKPMDSELAEALREHSLAIRRIGNNLNQLAHAANIFEDVDRNRVFEHLKQLQDEVAAFVAKQREGR